VGVVWRRGVGRASPAAPDTLWRRWGHQTTPMWNTISHDTYVLVYVCVYVCNKPPQPNAFKPFLPPESQPKTRATTALIRPRARFLQYGLLVIA
jgi:hypothetical protein